MLREKFITRKFMEDFGLDYPKDLEKFHEVLFKITDRGGSLNQLFTDLVEAFPDKKEKILKAPMFKTIDGKGTHGTVCYG
jgi:ABC-type glycerol-3-phosphate transport system substrate-binding protein